MWFIWVCTNCNLTEKPQCSTWFPGLWASRINTTQPFIAVQSRTFSSRHRPVHCFPRPTPTSLTATLWSIWLLWLPVNIIYRRATGSCHNTCWLVFKDVDNLFVDELCHFAMCTDIFKDYEPENIINGLFLYKFINNNGMQDTFSKCSDRAKNVLSFDGN